MEKTGYIYVWFDRKHKRFYIGSHWGTETDGYICSSRWMRKSYRRRPSDFKRRIIEKGIKKSDLLLQEDKWLRLIPDNELGKRYYNLYNKRTITEWQKRRISRSNKVSQSSDRNSQKGSFWITDGKENRKCYDGIIPNGFYRGRKFDPNPLHKTKPADKLRGRKLSEDHKQKIKDNWNKSGNRIPWNKGIK